MSLRQQEGYKLSLPTILKEEVATIRLREARNALPSVKLSKPVSSPGTGIHLYIPSDSYRTLCLSPYTRVCH